jgi:hypothetical protein
VSGDTSAESKITHNDKEKIVTDYPNSGAEPSSDQQTSAGSGAPASTGFQPVQPVAQQAPAAYAAPVAAPPAKSGPSALKIILIIVAVIFGLGILGVSIVGYGIYKVAHAVKVSQNGDVSMNVPGVTANSSDSLSASDLGVDIYPGAEQAKGGFKMNIAGTSSVIGKFVTSDSKDAVFAFYKDKLGPDANSFNFASSATISVNKSPQESILVTIVPNSGQAEGKTQISIQHTKKN